MEEISSRHNPKLKQARALRDRKHRQGSGRFLVEGIYHVGAAVEAGAGLESIFFSPDYLHSDFALALIEEQSARGVHCYAAPPAVFDSLADKDNPQGIIAVARQRQDRLDQLTPQNFPWGVALVAPQDPGNLGAILRTIDAVGASGLLLLDATVDPYHPTAVRASMGAIFWHPVVMVSFTDFAQWVRRHSYHVYGTSAHASRDYQEIPTYERPLILLMGSEREGLTAEQAGVCQELIRLPMHGHVTSLNLAVAAGVMLYAIKPTPIPPNSEKVGMG